MPRVDMMERAVIARSANKGNHLMECAIIFGRNTICWQSMVVTTPMAKRQLDQEVHSIPRDRVQLPILWHRQFQLQQEGMEQSLQCQTNPKTKMGQVINTADATAVFAWNGLQQGV